MGAYYSRCLNTGSNGYQEQVGVVHSILIGWGAQAITLHISSHQEGVDLPVIMSTTDLHTSLVDSDNLGRVRHIPHSRKAQVGSEPHTGLDILLRVILPDLRMERTCSHLDSGSCGRKEAEHHSQLIIPLSLVPIQGCGKTLCGSFGR
jgi:hypothetical protein